ncbi:MULTISPECIES: trypsin-like peptidase domain-containing protein [Cyanophyceae]|uniref:Serine protease n=1 Tax=Leptolyngbya subtilissima DQ-A4 TaxID=2933933 RepID=A0ABV0KAC1_9CYAN|nr:trypsin-like peptidase domain-containing protein [Nodosilinea sp. FACHB-141]MBD2115207.1 trypsin-like peptidase domain-containing protein [Nodosilinea sp. FACHB-141]
MLKLSNDDRKALREAIQSAYPDRASLEIFVDDELNQNLAVVAGDGKHDKVIFDLIKWAIAKGYIDDLILALAADTENRPDIQQFCRQVLRQRLVLNPPDGVTRELSLDLDPSAWDIDIRSEELEGFLPQQFTFEADVGKLQEGLGLANAVCKITFSDRPARESGTGVLIAPDLVLTNFHVLSREVGADLNALAQTAQFEFGYVSTPFGEPRRTQQLTVAGQTPVVAASPIAQLDYALIRLSPGTNFAVKPVPLNATAQLKPRSPLNILQHPEGEALKVSLSNNGVVKTNEPKGLVLYVNPTKQGASGSPCFDDDWHLVALHHKALQTSFGSVREGILMSAIYPQIASFL